MNVIDVQADIVVSSLTKTFSGASNLMAGSLILNPNTSAIRYDALSKHLYQLNSENDLPYLPKYDAEALEYNSRFGTKVLSNSSLYFLRS